MQTSKFIQLESELESYKPVMAKAADSILNEQISKYPIMVIHQEEIQIGINLVDRKKVEGNWSVNLSTLEEFVSKGLIESHKIDSFRTIYKDKKKFICLFVLSELGAQFVFISKKRKDLL